MKAGTLAEFANSLIAQLEREEPELRERNRTMLRDAFIRIAMAPAPARSYEQIKADYRAYRARTKRIEPEPLPELPPLPPGKARVVSF